jgi:PAS domain S-box-containing protein
VLDQALTGGSAQTVGRFWFFIDDERWEWSDEVQQIHGYAPGEMPNPTTKEVLSHKHPDDYEHVLGALEDTRRTRAAFSTRHRMIDKQGREHRINVVGDLMRGADGEVIGTQGFYIDVTPAESRYEERITDRVAEIIKQRATIEHAVGMLAVIYGFEVDAGFELLKWMSQRSNTKLKDVAERVVTEFRGLSAPVLPQRNVYDEVLMMLARGRALTVCVIAALPLSRVSEGGLEPPRPLIGH